MSIYSTNKRFERIKREEKRRQQLAILITISLVVCGYLTYKYVSGDFKFLFRETTEVSAEVVYLGSSHLGKSYYLYWVRYEYEFQDSVYQGEVNARHDLGRYYEGQVIRVRIATESPEINEFVTTSNR